MIKQRIIADRKFLKSSSSDPTFVAIRFLIDHIKASKSLITYTIKTDPVVKEILDQDGKAGHWITLPTPPDGFTPLQRDRIESYAEALTYWRRLILEIDWREKEVMIAFRAPHDGRDDMDDEHAPPLKERLRDLLKEKDYKVARELGRGFVNQGFKVREPVPASLVSMDSKVNGHAVLLRYPYKGEVDEAGIGKAYDTMVPRLADVYARENGMACETVKDEEFSTVFVTKKRKFISSLYESRPQFRMITRRQSFRQTTESFFTMFKTLRACRIIKRRYKNDFVFFRPMPAMGLHGHTLAMIYRDRVAGHVVEGAYLKTITNMTEKLMNQYNLRASIQHRPESRAIQISFYSGIDETAGRPHDAFWH